MNVYKQYCNEIVDKNGRLQKITLEYPDNFNFGYDVVDKIANEKSANVNITPPITPPIAFL